MPPPTAGERETLLGYLNEQRALLLWKLEGLTRDQAMHSTVPSGTSLLGLVKHLDVQRVGIRFQILGGDRNQDR